MTRWRGWRRISRSAIRWWTGRGTSAMSTATTPPPPATPKPGMTAAAEALLEGLESDAVDFRDNYDGTLREPVVLPAAFPNLSGQRVRRHRGRHGDQHPAPQSGRTDRRLPAPDQVPQRPRRHPCWSMSPDQTFRPAAYPGRTAREYRRSLPHRTRGLSPARPLADRGSGQGAPGRSSSRKSPIRRRNPA